MPSFVPALLALAVFLCACTAPQRTPDEGPKETPSASVSSPSTHTWQKGPYQIRFAAGPLLHQSEGHPKSFSTYEVVYKEEDKVLITAIATSAIGIETFIYSSNSNPAEFIQVFVSPSQSRLLISEIVPNDCCPCSNFILVELAGGQLKTSYLKMPTWKQPKKPTELYAPIFSDEPTVRSLTDEEIEFEYSDKEPHKLRLQDIPRSTSVKFPG